MAQLLVGAGLSAATAGLVTNVAISVGLGLVQRALTPDTIIKQEGARLTSSQIMMSQEGSVIPRINGRVRIGGQLIWATTFFEDIVHTKTTQGGKGGPKVVTKSTEYIYSSSFAVALCEGGPGTTLGRIWSDGKLLDLSNVTYRFYNGNEDQLPDPKIESVEGVGTVSAYRGVAYVVFEDMVLTDYGNRIPQLTFEINRTTYSDIATAMETTLEAVNMIPGSGEFVYGTQPYTSGGSVVENLHGAGSDADIVASLDQLEESLSNVTSASLVVTWFGDSLDATVCEIKPKVDSASKRVTPTDWYVSDVVRSTADLVSEFQGEPAFGGTPSDSVVREAVVEMKARGLRVMFYPFISMEVPISIDVTNGDAEIHTAGVLSDWTSVSGNLVSANVGASHSGTRVFDGAALGTTHESYQDLVIPAEYHDDVDAGYINVAPAFFRITTVSDLAQNTKSSIGVEFFDGSNVSMGPTLYSDDTPFSIIGEEFETFTLGVPSGARKIRTYIRIQRFTFSTDSYIDSVTLRFDLASGSLGRVYPWRGEIVGDPANFVGTDVPSDFGNPTNTSSLSYIDWLAEQGISVGFNSHLKSYNAYKKNFVSTKYAPYSGSGEWTVRRMVLHYAALLKDLLTSGDAFIIGSEMVGLSSTEASWGTMMADVLDDVRTILPAGVNIGYAANWSEYKMVNLDPVWDTADFIGIDYYMPLTDWRVREDEDYSLETFMEGVHGGEYWDYYYADDAARLAGTQSPISDPEYRQKDIRYWHDTYYPSKPIWLTEFGCGAVHNGANEPNIFPDNKSALTLPNFSNGRRNDIVQRLYIEGLIEYWSDEGLIDPANMFVWTWDARPYPSFPNLTNVWSDGSNWPTGHWLNGRLGTSSLESVVIELCGRMGVEPARVDAVDLRNVSVRVQGMLVASLTSPRAVLENMMRTYLFDAYEDGQMIKFFLRINSPLVTIDLDDLVMSEDGKSYHTDYVKDVDLPDRTKVNFIDASKDYQDGSVDGHTVTGFSNKVESFTTICVLNESYARSLADVLTQEKWIARHKIMFSVPIGSEFSGIAYLGNLKPGFTFEMIGRLYRVERLVYGDAIEVTASGFSNQTYEVIGGSSTASPTNGSINFGPSHLDFIETPLRSEDELNHWSPRIAAWQTPWPGSVSIFLNDGSGGYELNTAIPVKAITGRTTTDLPKGPLWVWDNASTVTIALDDSTANLSSMSDKSVLNGANTVLIETLSGEYEVLQFANATLNVDGTFTISRLLRGQLGTDFYMDDPTPAGARFIVYDSEQFGVFTGTLDGIGIEFDTRYGPSVLANSDPRYQSEIVTSRGVAYRPYAPVHLEQSIVAGDITLSWIRRNRFASDSWNIAEIPMSEGTERYDIEIIDGLTVVRTESVASVTEFVYTNAMQVADFGSSQTSVVWRVYQMSSVFGRGTPANG